MESVLTVYVPRPGSYSERKIVKGSGIVGTEVQNGIIAYFEGNIYGAENIRTFEDKLYHAASRLVTRYPTAAKIWAPREDMVPVGTYDYGAKALIIDADKSAVLREWNKV